MMLHLELALEENWVRAAVDVVVTLEDVSDFAISIENASVRAPLILCRAPLQNAEFTRCLQRQCTGRAFLSPLHSGSRWRKADALLLSSQRVAPQVLEKTGIDFCTPICLPL